MCYQKKMVLDRDIMIQTSPREPVDAGNDNEVQSSPLPVYTDF